MGRALRVISVERGLDPREFALVAFGGAGGLHACALAEELGIAHRARAARRRRAERARARDLRRAARLRAPAARRARRARAARGRLRGAGGAGARGPGRARAAPPRRPALPRPVVRADGRGRRPRRARRALPRGARARYGYRMEGEPVELVNARVVATVRGRAARAASPRTAEGDADGRRRAAPNFDGDWSEVAGLPPRAAWATASRSRARRSSSSPRRPASCGRAGRARSTTSGTLVLERDGEPRPRHPVACSPARCRASPRRWARCSIRGAYSSNIKERRDCSAALFDADGRDGRPGRAHPGPPRRDARGGRRGDRARARARRRVDRSTTPTAAAPTCRTSRSSRRSTSTATSSAYAVTRAHHSDVGGMRPGSMPADSRDVYQEGLIIPPVRLRDGERRTARADPRQRAHARHPPRRPARADGGQPARRAAAARSWSSGAGATSSSRRSRRSSPTPSGARARRCATLPDGTYEAERAMEGDGVTDDDVPIRASRDGRRRRAVDRLRRHRRPGRRQRQLPARGHALGLLLRAAGRCCPSDVPANAGTYAALEHRGARGLARQRAVAGRGGGRQRRDLAARSPTPCSPRSPRRSTCPPQGQGTMNNLIIGGRGWTYYETIGGGQGASASGPGPVGRARRDERTRSTRRSRRSSSSTRCASSATSCATAPAATASTGAATASSARCACSSRRR